MKSTKQHYNDMVENDHIAAEERMQAEQDAYEYAIASGRECRYENKPGTTFFSASNGCSHFVLITDNEGKKRTPTYFFSGVEKHLQVEYNYDVPANTYESETALEITYNGFMQAVRDARKESGVNFVIKFN
jgi:hypothetical protein